MSISPPPKGTPVGVYERFSSGRIGERIHPDYDLTFDRVQVEYGELVLWRLTEASGPRNKTYYGYVLARPVAVKWDQE
jgi:hypothetical protein